MGVARVSASVDAKLAREFDTKVVKRFYGGNTSAGIVDGMRKLIKMADVGELVIRSSALPESDLKEK